MFYSAAHKIEVLAVNSHGGSIPPPRTRLGTPVIADGSGPFAFLAPGVERAGISGTNAFGARNGARTVRPRWLRVGVGGVVGAAPEATAAALRTSWAAAFWGRR